MLLTVAFSVFIAGNVQTAEKANADRRAEATGTQKVVVPDGTPGLSDAAAPTGDLLTSVYIGERVTTAAGSPSGPGDGHVVVAESRARELGVAPGGTIIATFADGAQVALRVSAIQPDRPGSAGMLLPRRAVRSHDPSALVPAMPLDGGAPPKTSPGGGEATAPPGGGEATAPPGGSQAMAHSALAVVVGSFLGIAAAVLALRVATAGLRAQTGTSVALTVPWPVLAAAAGTCFVLAVIAATLPARACLTAANPLRERA